MVTHHSTSIRYFTEFVVNFTTCVYINAEAYVQQKGESYVRVNSECFHRRRTGSLFHECTCRKQLLSTY